MNEKLQDFNYQPKPYYLGMTAVRLVFQPSDKLEESLKAFVKPEERRKYSARLISDEVKRLHYTGADSYGFHYMSTNSSLEGENDRDWIHRYKQSIDQIKSQSIPVAAYRPRLEMVRSGALSIEFALLPNEMVKKKIGGSVLRHLRINPYSRDVDEVIYARTLIPPSQLADEEAISEAQTLLTEHLGVIELGDDNDYQSSHESPKTQRMFVKTAFINDRLVS